MNCRDAESLIQAERDGALSDPQRATLSAHVAACPACRQQRAELAGALAEFAAEIRAVRVPDVDAAWHDVRAQLSSRAKGPRGRKRRDPLSPVIWFGAPVAAAAAVALAFIGLGTPDAPPTAIGNTPEFVSDTARADYVEAGDANASTMVYVDKDSGWLVVWATDAAPPGSG